MYYRVSISETGKEPRSKQGFRLFNRIEEHFRTLEGVKDFLRYRYPKVRRRRRTYRDIGGKSVHTGYIYRYRNDDISHNSKQWIQEDWVEVYECSDRYILV